MIFRLNVSRKTCPQTYLETVVRLAEQDWHLNVSSTCPMVFCHSTRGRITLAVALFNFES